MGDAKQINKSAIKNFAIEARNILIKSAITEAGFYGISKDEISRPVQKGADFEVYKTAAGTDNRIFGSDIKRRANLVKAIQEKGFDEVIEETAYTWFNRLIAIRFMEVNDYLPSRVRVLSSETGSGTPDLVTQFLDVDLNMSEEEIERVQKAKDDNQYDEAFRLLFIKACNELNDILPGLFEKTDDYKELLLNLPYTSNGVVRMLVDTIPESNFNVNEGGQVEIIGWLYQYYNTEPKAKAFAKKGKITKEEIPAVTQLFTPDWIVRYMVENSLGRLWIEHLLSNGDRRSEQEIANDFGWKYYLPEAEQEPEVQVQLAKIREERKELSPQDILCIDPCQGSGHILVYLYDVLMQIYREDGYSERDAARSILENNLYGLDIDDRAYQLSYFAVIMKARQYDRVVLKKKINPHVFSIQESNSINRTHLKYFGTADTDESIRNKAVKQLTYLLDTFKDAKEYGSILNVKPCDWDLLREYVENDVGQFEFEALGINYTKNQLLPLLEIGEILANKYHVVITNPPYMGGSGMSEKLQDYVKSNYPQEKTDLFACFIKKNVSLGNTDSFISMITMESWMFLASFEELRTMLLLQTAIQCLTHMPYLGKGGTSLGINFGTVMFCMRKGHFSSYFGNYNCVTYLDTDQEGIPREFPVNNNRNRIQNQNSFKLIPATPYGYWLSQQSFENFAQMDTLGEYISPRIGLITGDNNRFLRLWHEVEINKIGFGMKSIEESADSNYKWFPYQKGGDFRKWYGNLDYVVDWENDGYLMKNDNFDKGRVRSHNYNGDYSFIPCITWTSVTTGTFACRYSPEGFLFDAAGPICKVNNNDDIYLFLGILSSAVARYYLGVINPTINFHPGYIMAIPFSMRAVEDQKDMISKLAEENTRICQEEWDQYERSWNFHVHPLCSRRTSLIKNAYEQWQSETQKRKEKLRENEEVINALTIQAYGLEGEISEEVDYDSTTVREANLSTDIRSLISYAVGCMFGRYSLDVEGLVFAGGAWENARATQYTTFQPDEDAIIPITDEEYFKDDIVERFVNFIRIVYGEDTIEANLKFIADALGKKGNSSRAVIRNYFLNDFYRDHCNTYSVTGSGKRPIYWLFDSGKQNGFKALIYIHRYTPDTVGLIRSVYLHNAQEAIQNSLKNAEYVIATSASAVDRAANTKKRDKYIKQLNELRPYYQAISHVALQRIEMDLDDGVKKNYQLFQGIEISSEGKKKQTIDLLAKI